MGTGVGCTSETVLMGKGCDGCWPVKEQSRADIHHSCPVKAVYASVCLVAQSRPTLCSPVDRSPPGSSVHGILQARMLEWVACPPPGKYASTPLQRFVHVLTTSTCECDPIWKKDLYRCNQAKDLKMRSLWINPLGPESNDRYASKRRRKNRRLPEGMVVRRWRQGLGRCSGKLSMAWGQRRRRAPQRLSRKEPFCQGRRCQSAPGSGGPLEEGMATHFSILSWEIPWTEEPGGGRVVRVVQSMGHKESDTT